MGKAAKFRTDASLRAGLGAIGVLGLLASAGALAQAPAPAPATAPPAAAPAAPAAACATLWPPCGPDRVLGESEIRTGLIRPGEPTRIDLTGGVSGRKFVLVLRPDSKLDMSAGGGGYFGRDWKLEDGKLCLRLYQNIWRGQYNCGDLEVKDGRLYWLDKIDASRNLITAVSVGSR
ncbi:hypothetical protein GCM10028813_35260 [Ramlibacter alkalitolerans]